MDVNRIEHVFVLQMENRSFDQVLGALALAGKPVDGVDLAKKRHNLDASGSRCDVRRVEGESVRIIKHDAPHGAESVARQIAGDMGGFVKEYQAAHPSVPDLRASEVMHYFDGEQLPMTHFLAEHFAISDRWYCPIPTDTIPNRLYSMCGSSAGIRNNPPAWRYGLGFPIERSVFTALNDSWRIYAGAVPAAALIRPVRRKLLGNKLKRIHDLEADLAGSHSKIPRLVWIEPTYSWVEQTVATDALYPTPNDDHPPSDVRRGQALIQYVYQALTANTELWNRSLLVIYYDEHGGFYDHQVPPEIAPEERQPDEFQQRGPRVPALVVSPFVTPGAVVRPAGGKVFDHCSVLKFICERFGIEPWTKRIASDRIGSLSEFLTDQPAAPARQPTFNLLAEKGLGIKEAVEGPALERAVGDATLLPSEHAAGLDNLRLALERESPEDFARIYPDLAGLPPVRGSRG